MNNTNDHIDRLILLHLEGSISDREQQELDSWRQADPENTAYFSQLEKIYRAAGQDTVSPETIDTEAEWQYFKQRIAGQQENRSTPRWYYGLAASLALIGVFSLLFYLWFGSSNTATLTADKRGVQVLLSDSTLVTLNKGATLTYPVEFTGKAREVKLQGEAYFEVKHRADKPFRVLLSQSKVEVLGTKFNIYAPQKDSITEVTVTEGKVRFSTKDARQAVILTKGEKGVLMKTNHQLTESPNSDVNFLAWKTGKLVFNEVDLAKVINTLNRIYEANIRFNTEVGQNCKVTVSFDNQSLDAILSVLEATLDLEYRQQGNVIEIIRAGC